MTLHVVMAELEKSGTAQNRKTYARHGAREPMFGVSCAIQIKLAKPLRGNQQLAEELWQSGNFDARWLAFRIAEALLLLERIERDIHTAPNRVRESMNGALIAIALVDKTCEENALAAARRIGKVVVDHGDTCCKTPDAVTYIAKCVAHREKQASKRAEKRVARC